MFSHRSLLIHFAIPPKHNAAPNFLLAPEQRHAAPDAHMNVVEVVTFDDLLSLNEIRGVSLGVQTTTVEPCPRHIGTASAYGEVLPAEMLRRF